MNMCCGRGASQSACAYIHTMSKKGLLITVCGDVR